MTVSIHPFITRERSSSCVYNVFTVALASSRRRFMLLLQLVISVHRCTSAATSNQVCITHNGRKRRNGEGRSVIRHLWALVSDTNHKILFVLRRRVIRWIRFSNRSHTLLATPVPLIYGT
eukprot:gene11390-7895_t